MKANRQKAREISLHNDEISENIRHWNRKPELRNVYRLFYADIASQLEGTPPGPLLECGSGIGNLKSVLPHAITSDLFENPWLDRRENVYALSFPSGALSGIVLFDVFHHLQYPGSALRELRRVLHPSGRLVIFEPSMGLLGRLVLGLCHHEPLGLKDPITWTPPSDFNAGEGGYYAAQGNAWRIFSSGHLPQDLATNWKIRYKKFYPAVSWLLSGGFRGPRLLRGPIVKLASFADTTLSTAPRFFSSRMLITLEPRHPDQRP